MKAALPDADIVDYQALIPNLSLPDTDDRHVLAAAITGGAEAIVTWNLKDFPASHIGSHGISSVSPDDFLVSLHAAFPNALISSVARARQNLRRTTPTVDEFIDALDRQSLTDFASILRRRPARLA